MNRLGKLVLFWGCSCCFAAAGSGAVFAAEQAPTTESTAVEIVAFLHLSGDSATEGKAYQQGIELAALEVNEQAASSGRKLSVSFQDTGHDPTTAASEITKALENPAVSGLIVSRQFELKKIAAAVEKEHVPTIVLGDSSPLLEQTGDYIFGIGPWTPSAGQLALEFAAKTLKAKTTYIVSTNDEWYSEAAKTYFDGALKAGISVLGTSTINREDKDFLSLLSRARGSGADLIYMPIATNISALAKQMDASNFQKPVILSDALSAQVLQASKRYLNGFHCTRAKDPSGPATDSMQIAFRAKLKSEPVDVMSTALGYDALKMFAGAYENGASTRESLKEVLSTVKDFPGASGNITMNEKGSRPLAFSMFRVTDGKLEIVESGSETAAGSN